MTTAILMIVGEQAEVTLPSLGTAGYRWSETLAGDTDAVSLRWQRWVPIDEAKPRLAGVSAPERLLLVALAPGRLTVRLEQRRPWEAGPPKAERTVEVRVLASGPKGD